MIIFRLLFSISQLIDDFNELFGCDLYLSQDFSDQRTRQIAPRMLRQSCGSSIRMPIKNVAAFLSDSHKAHLEEHLLHGPEINYREMGHIGISICCNPTKWGRSGRSASYSSRQSPITSFKFSCSSSKVSAWVWAPGNPGTLPTYRFVPGSNSM